MSAIDPSKAVAIDYVNHRGERAMRRIQPEYLWWGVTAWHPREGWLLHAWDFEKLAWRDFAWSGIVGPGEQAREELAAATRISDPEDEKAALLRVRRALMSMEFHEHLLRKGHPELARDMIAIGLLEGPPRSLA